MSLTSLFQLIVCFEIDVLVCILFPVQFSKIMCTSAVLIYITKYFILCKPLFLKSLKKEKDTLSSILQILLSIFNCADSCNSTFMSFALTKWSIQERMHNIFTRFNTCCSLSHT